MKRLIVCCDGTWQDLECPCPTNVFKMAQAVKPRDQNGVQQTVYYDEGIGTKQGVPWAEVIEKIGSGAFGLGIDHKIQDAYRFLCMNYEEGDEIYLVGFSRGAYTVRCLAGLSHNSGILARQFIRKIPDAYQLYRDRSSEAAPDGEKAIRFRHDFCIDYCSPNSNKEQDRGRVPIRALCCWDTVGSLGIPDLIPFIGLDKDIQRKYQFFDYNINHLIEFAFHAVAVDEIRAVFNVTPMEPSPDRTADQVTQVWFPGGHGCIGGGSKEEQGLSDAALLWMIQQVEALGLALDETRIEGGINPRYDTPFDNEPKGIYRRLGVISRKVTGSFFDLDDSVKKRWNDPTLNYHPENLMAFKQELDAYAAEKVHA